tara:strand:- start:15149 stop:15358 length:210 start_codon:yes stop_codon:yes gene_type:complete
MIEAKIILVACIIFYGIACFAWAEVRYQNAKAVQQPELSQQVLVMYGTAAFCFFTALIAVITMIIQAQG